MNNVNTNLEEIFKTLFPMNNIDPEGFVINSRDLHKAMNVGRDYNTWVKGRISKYGFEKELDFTIIEHSSSQIVVDYYVTLDVAKELCMVENNDAGKALRRYFIQAEKALRTLEPELTEEIQSKVLGCNQFLDSSNTCSAPEGLG